MNTIETLITKINGLHGVVSASLWEKAENPRIYVNFYSQNNRSALLIGSGRSAQTGKFWIEITPDGAEIHKKFTAFSGAYTREVVQPAIENIKAAVEEFNRPAAIKKSPKAVMTRAWEIAREAAAKFGGKSREYFALSLKQAWAE